MWKLNLHKMQKHLWHWPEDNRQKTQMGFIINGYNLHSAFDFVLFFPAACIFLKNSNKHKSNFHLYFTFPLKKKKWFNTLANFITSVCNCSFHFILHGCCFAQFTLSFCCILLPIKCSEIVNKCQNINPNLPWKKKKILSHYINVLQFLFQYFSFATCFLNIL